MKKKKKLTNQELIQFCEHMSMVLKSGLTPAAGIELLLDDTKSTEGRAILEPISEKCNEGCSFPEALRSSGVFPEYALNLIELGNTSGKLEEVMDSLAFHYTREETLVQDIKSAVTYPFIIIFMMIVVIVVLLVKVLPIFQEVFIQLGTELTGFSAALLDIGEAFTSYSVVFICVFVLLLGLFLFFTRFERGRKAMARFCGRFVLTRSFFNKVAVSRFASGMAITISAGLDLEKSLDLVENLVEKTPVEEKIKKCKGLMYGEDGVPVSFSKALIDSAIFNNVNSKMISIGFTTGNVDQVFKKISEQYSHDIEQRMNRAVSILEPTLVIILSIIVCLILLSVIMPLMGVMSSMG